MSRGKKAAFHCCMHALSIRNQHWSWPYRALNWPRSVHWWTERKERVCVMTEWERERARKRKVVCRLPAPPSTIVRLSECVLLRNVSPPSSWWMRPCSSLLRPSLWMPLSLLCLSFRPAPTFIPSFYGRTNKSQPSFTLLLFLFFVCMYVCCGLEMREREGVEGGRGRGNCLIRHPHTHTLTHSRNSLYLTKYWM